MSDRLASGRTFRTLSVIDDFSRQALWIEVAVSLPSQIVIGLLEALILWHGQPDWLRTYNTIRPHEPLRGLPLQEFADKHGGSLS